MSETIRPMVDEDLGEVLALWRATPGIGLSSADTIEGVSRFLDRNPGLSLVALDAGRVVGAVLCGHDGRRGYLHHLAVSAEFRHRGVGRRLADRCLVSLAEIGIRKCHLFVFESNEDAIAFWRTTGWTERSDLCLMSHET